MDKHLVSFTYKDGSSKHLKELPYAEAMCAATVFDLDDNIEGVIVGEVQETRVIIKYLKVRPEDRR